MCINRGQDKNQHEGSTAYWLIYLLHWVEGPMPVSVMVTYCIICLRLKTKHLNYTHASAHFNYKIIFIRMCSTRCSSIFHISIGFILYPASISFSFVTISLNFITVLLWYNLQTKNFPKCWSVEVFIN